MMEAKRFLLLAAVAIVCVLAASFLAGLLHYYLRRAPVAPLTPGVLFPAASFHSGTRALKAPELEYAKELAGAGETAGGGEVELPRRMIAWEAFLRLEVEDVGEAAERAVEIAEELNGYLAYSEVGEEYARVALKVPSERFYEALSRLGELGEVAEQRVRAEEVTEQWIDLNARLKTAREEEERLLELLERAETVDDVLKVEAQLRRVREEIERLEAQLRYLETRVEYSTISLELREPAEPGVEWPTFNLSEAVASGLRAMYAVVYGMVVLAMACLPVAAIGVPAYLLYKGRIKLPGLKRESESR